MGDEPVYTVCREVVDLALQFVLGKIVVEEPERHQRVLAWRVKEPIEQ